MPRIAELDAAEITLSGVSLTFNFFVRKIFLALPASARLHTKSAKKIWFPYIYSVEDAVRILSAEAKVNIRYKFNTESLLTTRRESSKSAALRSCVVRVDAFRHSILSQAPRFRFVEDLTEETDIRHAVYIEVTSVQNIPSLHPTTVEALVKSSGDLIAQWGVINWTDSHEGCSAILQAAGCVERYAQVKGTVVTLRINSLSALVAITSTGVLPGCAAAAVRRLSKACSNLNVILLPPNIEKQLQKAEEVQSYYVGRERSAEQGD